MSNLQKIDNQQSKYDEIIKYLKQDNGYWLENDKWDLKEKFFVGKIIKTTIFLNFSTIKNLKIKNEVKYYFLFNFKENLISIQTFDRQLNSLKNLSEFINKFLIRVDSCSLLNMTDIKTKWTFFLLNKGFES